MKQNCKVNLIIEVIAGYYLMFIKSKLDVFSFIIAALILSILCTYVLMYICMCDRIDLSYGTHTLFHRELNSGFDSQSTFAPDY